eukprot:TRINITY_DN6099_c0_g1_i1.p1 TRINITY_DN6099_c0_g1~~TRINITY_DN6099_c0_g1_i1.p1  ORF type:complete len:171 (+),score=6.45 TRINITY_DN6099_c0_g1_i1:71-583(+)
MASPTAPPPDATIPERSYWTSFIPLFDTIPDESRRFILNNTATLELIHLRLHFHETLLKWRDHGDPYFAKVFLDSLSVKVQLIHAQKELERRREQRRLVAQLHAPDPCLSAGHRVGRCGGLDHAAAERDSERRSAGLGGEESPLITPRCGGIPLSTSDVHVRRKFDFSAE